MLQVAMQAMQLVNCGCDRARASETLGGWIGTGVCEWWVDYKASAVSSALHWAAGGPAGCLGGATYFPLTVQSGWSFFVHAHTHTEPKCRNGSRRGRWRWRGRNPCNVEKELTTLTRRGALRGRAADSYREMSGGRGE